ncbi:MAG: hypothetical protein M2R45_00172 [Verrucomicrobia subdivision 3 bacterium]|nr:hypothetical protein [Limisphaerales bacterium]MCS1412369.1 hypothetical protein [Limisphaerales bacterium]
MPRAILSFIAGLIIAGIAIGFTQRLNLTPYPIPAGIDTNDSVSLKKYRALIPIGGLLLILVVRVVDVFIGALATAVIAPRSAYISCTGVGRIILAKSACAMITIGTPTWF